ncbi:hypothetical protein [Campylobacter showae]|uniref:Periplasmic protein n=1 Tax=Campylobacter showae CC57C TaxID=1073353 RepID=M3I4C3_9BACT|nr:hypothetical protein [Campylobacter showae]EMG31464.1 hypothetical protein H740_01118 [Campylobacter showae CC57C]
MRKILTALLICSALFARSDKPSDIPPASEIYINLEPVKCNDICLLELVREGLLHSFLARYEGSSNQEILQAFNALNGSYVNVVTEILAPNSSAEFKIAVIIPQDSIKSYAGVVSNAVIAYVVRQNAAIDVKFYNIGNEAPSAIDGALARARSENIAYIIAPFTPVGAKYLNEALDPSMTAFVPTLHISSVDSPQENLIFGGIDYKGQVEKLLNFSNGQVAAFSDGSALGAALNRYADELSGGLAYENEIASGATDLKPMLSGNSRLSGATVFLNVPLVKASMVSSQMRLYDVKFNALLSTQINYAPSIFKLTQPQDREKLYIANSISKTDSALDSNNEILGQNLNFNWVGYSASAGLDYIYATYLNRGAQRLFSESVEDSQIVYDTKVLKAGEYGFYEQ